MSASAVRKVFDAAYYRRFYRNARTRAASARETRRQAHFVAAYLRHLDLPVRRIVDLGCGLGWFLETLAEEFPGARTHGVEWSAHLCAELGWEHGSVVDWSSRAPYDLVACHDVIQYLDARDAAAAIENLASLCRGALYLGVLTAEDWEQNCDRARTDDAVHLRPLAWYRRRLKPHFMNLGGGLHLRRPPEVTVWSMDRLE